MRYISLVSLLSLFLLGCATGYKTVTYNPKNTPKKPNYSDEVSWAALPGKYPKALLDILPEQNQKAVDVFFIYPTMLTDKRDVRWNADIFDFDIRETVLEGPVAFQSSAWGSSGNLYIPFYRQAHYRIFVDPYSKQSGNAWQVAYEDVRNAFAYYLENFNNGKPIIIAAHSQGSMHGKQLLIDFFDDKPLQKQLVAAYLVGIKISPKAFKTISFMENESAIGGFVSWNTYKMNKLPKKYETWYKGGATSNPITWDEQTWSSEDEHKGVLFTNGKLYPNSLSIKKIDGLVWSSLPKIPKRFLLSFVKNYHFADVNLFWGDIKANAALRVSSWFAHNNTNRK